MIKKHVKFFITSLHVIFLDISKKIMSQLLEYNVSWRQFSWDLRLSKKNRYAEIGRQFPLRMEWN